MAWKLGKPTRPMREPEQPHRQMFQMTANIIIDRRKSTRLLASIANPYTVSLASSVIGVARRDRLLARQHQQIGPRNNNFITFKDPSRRLFRLYFSKLV
ncbi:hypothetical protein [Acidicapsa acidisoli]|uniref:hypothetical protein n=1 Tax=Acidicapsa acidisoli TaxID=1615681 RepID=UPI0021E036AC|nr:hypothetical protein [Acidicapsa acidisoli]